jgi:hypothetical protein
MKFTDPIVFTPKVKPPSSSWWATPDAQATREGFQRQARAEENRICGNERFGGRKMTHDKFQQSAKRK